jgi:hypothetical protein
VVGNAASLFWRKKYALDAFGRRQTARRVYVHWFEKRIEPRQVELQELISERVRPLKTELVMVEESEPRLELVDGRWIQKTVKVQRPHERPVVATEPLHDEDGRPVFESQPRRDAEGRIVLDLASGRPVVDRVPVMVSVPVYDEEQEVEKLKTWVDTQDVEVKGAYHCYPADAVPAGVRAPAAAQRFEIEEPKLNPDFDERQDYTPREERPEWASVSYMGQEYVREGQPVGARWVRMGETSPGVAQWLVR